MNRPSSERAGPVGRRTLQIVSDPFLLWPRLRGHLPGPSRDAGFTRLLGDARSRRSGSSLLSRLGVQGQQFEEDLALGWEAGVGATGETHDAHAPYVDPFGPGERAQ